VEEAEMSKIAITPLPGHAELNSDQKSKLKSLRLAR
jgi:hypothetical protein